VKVEIDHRVHPEYKQVALGKHLIIKHAYAGTNDCFTYLRALFGTPSTAVFWPSQQAALLGIIPPTEVTQRLVLRLGFYDTGTIQVSLARTNLDLLATKAPPLKHRIPTSVLSGRMSLILYVLTNYCTNWAHKLVNQASRLHF
jgi:hypothetical protein